MRKQWRISLLVVLIASGLLACGRGRSTPKDTGPLTDSDRDSIRAIIARFDEKMQASDWAGAVTVYSDDAVLLPPNAPELRGRAAIQKFFEGFPKFSEFKEDVVEVQGDANLAYPRGTYQTTFIPPGAKAPVKDKGKVLAVWRKQPSGSWLVTRVIWNSDLAPPR